MRKRKNINMRKRKNIIVLVAVMSIAAASLSGCGAEAEAVNNEITDMKEREVNEITDMKEKEITPTVMPEGDNTETVGNATTVIPEKENTENKEKNETKEEVPINTTAPEITVTPMPETEPTFTEKDSVFLADDKKYKKANAVDEIDFKGMELYYRPYYVTIGQNEINLYQRNGLFAGYTKPGIQMYVFRGDDVWYGVYIDKEVYFIKKNDLEPVITATSEKPIQDDVEYDTIASGNSETTSEPDTDVKATPEPVTTPEPMGTPEPVITPEVVATPIETPEVAQPSEPNEPTTYSEDEVIAIVRETMENAGIQWYPDSDEYQRYPEFGLDGGMGWGEGYISMIDPYTDAAGIVEGYQYEKWTMYYLEVLGVFNDKVKIRLYRGQ